MPPYVPPSTSPTLLRLLALPGADGAWSVFIERYGRMIDERCEKAGLQPADAEDIRAAVFLNLLNALREFRHDPARRFRGYLQTVVDNAIRTHWRLIRRRPGWVGRGGTADEELPDALQDLGRELDGEIQTRLERVAAVLDRVRAEVKPETWRAFWMTAAEGLSGAEAAARLGKSVSTIYVAKGRVLARLQAHADPASEKREEGRP